MNTPNLPFPPLVLQRDLSCFPSNQSNPESPGWVPSSLLSPHTEEDLTRPPVPSLSSCFPLMSLTSLSFLAPNLSSVQGLCAQLHLQGFSTTGVCRGPRGICLPPDTAPTSQGPTTAQLKLCSLWRCLSMPAGVGPAPLGALGLCACGDTIPWPWQDHPLPVVCKVTRSEPLYLPQLPTYAGMCLG